MQFHRKEFYNRKNIYSIVFKSIETISNIK